MRTHEGLTYPIFMLSGVRQGCTLSPILFNLAIDSLERGARDSGEVADERVSILAYADDVGRRITD